LEIDEDLEMEESIENNGVSERDEVSKILNSMVKVVDSVANDETLSTHVDEEWLIEEKQVQALLKEAFKQANIRNDHALWKSLQEHSDEIKESFISDPTFRLWWNDFDSRTRRLPRACIKVMKNASAYGIVLHPRSGCFSSSRKIMNRSRDGRYGVYTLS